MHAAMKRGIEEEGEVDMANTCLMLLSKVGESCETNPSRKIELKGGAFKCKTCNKRFPSFQALGGHRASHKKPRLMVMGADLSSSPYQQHQLPSSKTMKPKMHRCPICGLGFAIGQALGGHMRKHRAAMNDGLLVRDHAVPILKKSSGTERFKLCLDLNLMPSSEEIDLGLNLRTPVLSCFI